MLSWAIILLVHISTTYCQEWELVWEDNFDTMDPNKWAHEVTAWGGGNFEFQVYTDDEANSYVKDGILYIKPTLLMNNINPLTGDPFGEDFLRSGVLDLEAMYGYCTQREEWDCYREGSLGDIPPIMSARMVTEQKFAFKFGRAEIRAKMPVGDWMWPAIWMLPENWRYGGWPLSGEIDIIEIIGNEDLKLTSNGEDVGIQKMGSTLHWGVDWNENRWYLSHATKHDSTDYGNNFHDFVFEWSEQGLSWTIDGDLLYQIPNPTDHPDWTNFYDYGAPWNNPDNPWAGASSMAPFDEDFHFILNVAVGGLCGFIPDDAINRGDNNAYGKPWNNNDDYRTAMANFWNGRTRWMWNWYDQEENAALQVDYIRVYQQV